jgi:hypothetical protein
MPVRESLLRLLAMVALFAAAAAMLARGGIGGEQGAIAAARNALRGLSFDPVGDPDAVLDVDQPLAWAVERSRPGRAGVALARGEAGAVRWRVRFPGGGEAVVAVGGQLLSVRRPVPASPGPDIFPWQVQPSLQRHLPLIVDDPGRFTLFRSQSWREGGSLWLRGRFLGGSGELPVGWRREAEVELAGSTPMALRRFVHPLGTDSGVVAGRIAELRMLRRPAVLVIGIVLLGALLAGAEAVAFHQRVAFWRGVGVAGTVVALGELAGLPRTETALYATVGGLAVALAPIWTSLPPSRPQLGPPVGAVLWLVVAALPALVTGVGGWMPESRPIPAEAAPALLLASAWLPALAEEPVLRGALPGLAGPVLGWWGGALLGAGIGAVLHPAPAVPLVASVAAELAMQAGLVLAARWGGVGAAVLARGTCEAMVWRHVYPEGAAFDRAALVGIAIGVVLLAWPRRRD